MGNRPADDHSQCGGDRSILREPIAKQNAILTALFGVASLASLTLSMVVLISVRNTFHDEIAQTESAAQLIRSAKKKLIFLALTPNLGFAGAARRSRFDICVAFTVALQAKLPELARRVAEGNGDVEVVIGLLTEADQNAFYARKCKMLKPYRGLRGIGASERYIYESDEEGARGDSDCSCRFQGRREVSLRRVKGFMLRMERRDGGHRHGRLSAARHPDRGRP